MNRRNRQLISIFFILAICLYIAPLALAQMGTQGGQGSSSMMGNQNGTMGQGGAMPGGMMPGHRAFAFNAKGSVVTPPPTDPATEQVMTVNIQQANRALRDLIGQDVTFAIDSNVRVMVVGAGLGGLDDVFLGDTVKVMGKAIPNADGTTTYEISRIMVY